ncbi:MAG: peptide chain release factor 2 [Gaiellaceae bacterium]
MFDVDRKRVRAAELREQSTGPGLWDDQDRAKALLGELARLDDDLALYDGLVRKTDDLGVLNELAVAEDDAASEAEVASGIVEIQAQLDALEVRTLLGGEYDERDAILTIHPGAGGTESQDWAEILLRMYLRWAEREGFEASVLEAQAGDEAGIKSATITVKGRFAYGLANAERGVHRLVRISPFDAAKRRHTSFASADVVPIIEEDTKIDIPPGDLRVDVFRSSGPGGQSVNTTDSAVRITHLPTGIVVTCQNERSQGRNRDMAMKVLRARLYQKALDERRAEEERRVGDKKSIEWGSQIRSYVLHPYRMVKDHRTGFETGNTDAVLDGSLTPFIEAFLKSAAGEGRPAS